MPKPDLEYVTEENLSKNYIPPSKTEALDYFSEVEQKKTNKYEVLANLAKKNPLVPIGCLITAGVLIRGIYAMKQRDSIKSQMMMRYRVGAQGVTILALVFGTILTPYFTKD
jgi:hypothetical protein